MTELSANTVARGHLETLFKTHGIPDFKWIDPKKIIVSHWVRMKCTFGCDEYGKNCCCPPEVPSVEECRQFFHEYHTAAIFHFNARVNKPEDRHAWTREINLGLSKLERDVFLAGYERTFLLFMDSCCLCAQCTGTRELCKQPQVARPGPEALAVDVFSTVRQYGFGINVRTGYDQAMDRYSFLMVA